MSSLETSMDGAAPPLPPERWVVATAQPQGAPDRLLAVAGPAASQLLQWRLRHGLVRFADATGLHAAAMQALASDALRVHLRSELPVADTLAALAPGFSALQTRRLDLKPADAPGAPGLADELAEPDNAALVQWLLTGRGLPPAVAPAGAVGGCAAEHRAAFAQWSAGYLQSQDEALLDELFCPADEDSACALAPDGAPAMNAVPAGMLAGITEFVQGVRQAVQGAFGGLMEAAPLGAAGADSHAMAVRQSWTLRGRGRTDGAADQVRLLAPAPLEPWDEPDGVRIQVRLQAEGWKGRRALRLVMHPAGHHKPVRLSLGDADALSRPGNGGLLHADLSIKDTTDALARALCEGTLELEYTLRP